MLVTTGLCSLYPKSQAPFYFHRILGSFRLSKDYSSTNSQPSLQISVNLVVRLPHHPIGTPFTLIKSTFLHDHAFHSHNYEHFATHILVSTSKWRKTYQSTPSPRPFLLIHTCTVMHTIPHFCLSTTLKSTLHNISGFYLRQSTSLSYKSCTTVLYHSYISLIGHFS